MKLKWFISMVILALGASVMAYRLGRQASTTLVLTPSAVPQLDYVVGPDSFSKVQNSKSTLAALCLTWRLGVETRLITAKALSTPSPQDRQRQLETAIHDLEQGLREFEGTDQQWDLAQDLLLSLKKADHLDRWTQIYLQALYERPLHPLVLRQAEQALTIGKSLGRENEVVAGLEHVVAIPREFEGKEKLSALLAREETRHFMTGYDTSRTGKQKGS